MVVTSCWHFDPSRQRQKQSSGIGDDSDTEEIGDDLDPEEIGSDSDSKEIGDDSDPETRIDPMKNNNTNAKTIDVCIFGSKISTFAILLEKMIIFNFDFSVFKTHFNTVKPLNVTSYNLVNVIRATKSQITLYINVRYFTS